jgi:microcystin-dependent protein
MATPFDNYQSSLTLRQILSTSALYPQRDGESHEQVTGLLLGQVRTFAGFPVPGGTFEMTGQSIPISQDTALFTILGTTYGGNGQTTFAIPNLDGVTFIGTGSSASAPVLGERDGSATVTLMTPQLPSGFVGGSAQPFDNHEPSLAVTYIIQTGASAAGNHFSLVGQVSPFAGNFAPDGFLKAEGQILNAADYPELFAAIGGTYGGDGVNTFALPDLRDRTIIGASAAHPLGSKVGDDLVALGAGNLPAPYGSGTTLDNHQPSLALKYLVAVDGLFPSSSSGLADNEAYLGEIIAYAGTTIPNGWHLADGALLPISQNTALFSLMGTVYGGNGITHFALPNLSDRAVIGAGTHALGDLIGSNTIALTPDNLPAITVETFGTPGDDSFEALPGNEQIAAGVGIDTVTFDFKLTDATVTYAGNQVSIDGPSNHTVLSGLERFVFTDGTVDNADGSPLIDDLFYYANNHDVWNAHADADAHFAASGWKESRDPSAFFDTSLYLALYPDVQAAGVNPLAHFDQLGWKEGRVPSFDFDPAAYLAANSDVKVAGVDPLAHFLQSGAQEGRNAFAVDALVAANGFDDVYYLANNADVAAAGVNPLQHFQQNGWQEGRDPNALFDVDGYIAQYGDVDAANVNPLDHYNTFGWREGRDPSIDFDTTAYLAANADVATAGVNPLVHFLHFGILEGRSAFADGIWG